MSSNAACPHCPKRISPIKHRTKTGTAGSAIGLMALMFCLTALFGCASPGPKMVDLAYSGAPERTGSGTLGLARFEDLRKQGTRGGLGHRVLNDKSREVFLVQGLDLATTLTDQTQSYLEKKGFTVLPIPPWHPDMDGLREAEGDSDTILTARIHAFYMTARKKGAMTEMTLKINLSFYRGKKSEKQLTTIPVALTLERTEVNFTREKVEAFFNQTLAEVLEKALVFN